LARYEQVQRHVIEARYLGDYKVWLEFNDGRKGVVDLADDLYGENFEPLRDRDRFAEFPLDTASPRSPGITVSTSRPTICTRS
jgi:hypothetical protein